MAKKKKEPYKKIVTNEIEKVLPQNVLKIGEQVMRDKNIYILQSVYKEIHDFTKDKLETESGGMLMGYTISVGGKTNIIINGFIEGKYSEGTPTTLKFTHDTWEYVNKEAELNYPDERIIGWIHTHPDFGIFLSEYDKFIQQNFFNEENQIAYVVDPIRQTEGFYFWINGQIETCPGFYIYDEVGTKIDILDSSNNECKNEDKSITPKNNNKLMYYLIGCILILSVVSLFYTNIRIISLNNKIAELNETVDKQNNSMISELSVLEQSVYAVQSNSAKCTIAFIDEDGTLISRAMYQIGDKVNEPDQIPVKESDEKYEYHFQKWDKLVDNASGDCTYRAVYQRSLREYTITFIDSNDNEISTEIYHYGDEIITEIPGSSGMMVG